MTSTSLNKGTNTGSAVKPKMDKSKVPSEPTKDEFRSFLSFSRENLSLSHSELEQGFNKIKPRIRRDTILSFTAIFFALFCIGLEIWKIQSVVDNARDIETLKHEVESMKHRLLEEDLLDELKAFEEMYAEEDSEDDDVDDSDDDNGDYDSVYDGEDEDDENDEDSKLSSAEYPGDFHSAPYDTHTTSSSGDSPASNREDDLKNVLASLKMAEIKSAGDNGGKIELEQFPDEDELPHSEQPEDLEDEDEEDDAEEFSEETDPATIKRKRSVDRKQPIGFNPSGVPIYAHPYVFRNKKNFTRKSDVPRLSLYDNLMKGEKITTEKSEEQPLIHHAVITSWDKHPPKKYYAQSRPATSHVTPPPLYAARVHNPNNQRHINPRRSGGWRDEGPQALTLKDETNRREEKSLRTVQKTRPLRRRGVTRRHLRAGRQIVAAHYGADSSLFTSQDEHIGNGKGRHYEGVFKAWKASNWMGDLGMSRHFTLSADGRLTVQEAGLYLIYAQIHYLDEHDENGFQVLLNNRSILQCMVYSPGTEHKSRSCFSAQATLLQSGDRLLLKDVGMDRYTLFQHDKSFFGLVRLGDTRPPRQQQQQQQQ